MKKFLTVLFVIISICSIIAACYIADNKSIVQACIISSEIEELTQQELQDKVLRLHIIANSDSFRDQKIKAEIREIIISEYEALFSSSESLNDSLIQTQGKLYEISQLTDAYLREQGFDYACSASICTSGFPDKTYGTLLFPQGNYTALKIILGNGEGQNWWCVLYPPLCFLNVHEDEKTDENGKITVKWKFAEWLKNNISK